MYIFSNYDADKSMANQLGEYVVNNSYKASELKDGDYQFILGMAYLYDAVKYGMYVEAKEEILRRLLSHINMSIIMIMDGDDDYWG